MSLLLPRVPDALIARAFDLVRNALAQLEGVPWVAGNVVTGFVFTAGAAAVVPHGLGRIPLGYVVIRSYGAATAQVTLYDGTPSTTPTKTLNVVCGATGGTADVFVF